MGVPEESYGPRELQQLKTKSSVVHVWRGKNGNWRVTVDVEIEVRLPDGRLVSAWEEVKIRGRGEPKRRPDPVWLYAGKQGRARERKKHEPCNCCDRMNEYNGFRGGLPHLFECPKQCGCHD